MAIEQPLGTDTLDSPDHAKQHRVIASDAAADDQSITVDASSNVDVANKLSVGSLETPYAQTLTVAESGGDFTTVTAALATITDAAETKRYLIQLAAGEYVENVTMKPYVDVVGMGSLWSSKITASVTSSPVVTGHGGCSIKNVTVAGATTSSGVYMAIPSAFQLENVMMKDCLYGVHCNSASARVYAISCAVDAGITTCSAAAYCTAGTLIVQSLVTTPGSTITSYLFANGGDIQCWNIAPQVAATNGLYVDNGGSLNAFSCVLPQCTYAMRVGSAGTGSRLTGGMVNSLGDNTWDLYVDSVTAVVKLMTCGIRSDNVIAPVGANVSFQGYDVDRDRTTFHLDVEMGTHRAPSSLAVGHGGSYQTSDVKIVSYDGTSYVDETSSDPIDFPNVNANTAIYFGDTDSHFFAGLSFIMGAAQLAIGTGSVVCEYYDGGAAAWVEVNSVGNKNGHSDLYGKTYFADAAEDDIVSVKFDQKIFEGIIENNAAATGWTATAVDGTTAMWLRCRIVTAITTSMQFSSVRLKSDYVSIRDNGTMSYHGAARVKGEYTFPLGEITGTAANEDIAVSSNITIALRENSFVNGQGDAMYYRYIIDESVDTSSSLTFRQLLLTPEAPSGADQTALLHITCAKVKEGENLGDSSAAETTRTQTVTFADGDAAYKSQTLRYDNRLDISDLEPGDSIYIKIERLSNEAGDDLADDVIVASAWINYKEWQNGSNYS